MKKKIDYDEFDAECERAHCNAGNCSSCPIYQKYNNLKAKQHE